MVCMVCDFVLVFQRTRYTVFIKKPAKLASLWLRHGESELGEQLTSVACFRRTDVKISAFVAEAVFRERKGPEHVQTF
jgi:hypothetical protein